MKGAGDVVSFVSNNVGHSPMSTPSGILNRMLAEASIAIVVVCLAFYVLLLLPSPLPLV